MITISISNQATFMFDTSNMPEGGTRLIDKLEVRARLLHLLKQRMSQDYYLWTIDSKWRVLMLGGDMFWEWHGDPFCKKCLAFAKRQGLEIL